LKCLKKFLPKYFVGKKIRNSLVSRGAHKPQKAEKKNYFLVHLNHIFYKNEPIDLVRGLFSSRPLGAFEYLFGPFGGAQRPQNSIKKLFSGCFGPFLLQE
jgi:hypothetical protein